MQNLSSLYTIQDSQRLHDQLLTLRRQSLGVILLVFFSVELVEISSLIQHFYTDKIFQWQLLLKIIITLLIVVYLSVIAISYKRQLSQIKINLVYILLWTLLLSELGFKWANIELIERMEHSILPFFLLLSLKTIVVQAAILSLPIRLLLKFVPMIFNLVLSLSCIAPDQKAVLVLTEAFICFFGLAILLLQMIKSHEHLQKIALSSIGELIFHKEIVKTVPVGILLTNSSFETIYHNNQIHNYLDTLPQELRSPRNLFKQFKGTQLFEDDLVNLFKGALKQKVEVTLPSL